MNDYNIGGLVASIRMDGLPQFQSDNDRARGSLEDTGKAAHGVRDALKATAQTASVMTAAVAAVTTGWLVSIFRTGAAYNTLQQTTRAALTTILGGTQAANEQMAKMDAFARESPFAKSTFLQAQQQMLGFGIEARKVIPYLDAIQNATAATGGNNQKIADLALIMSQISSAGKITGQDLLQFGARGVNAAKLIGDQMGVTEAEIRTSISKGTLDAQQALDALAAGMQKTYSGAAAGVKATWDGTKDRVKASNRDIGAALAEPFISQQGGGRAILWGNQVADVLRALATQAQPVVSILDAKLMPAWATITRDLDHARVTIKSWDSQRLEQFLDKASTYGPAVAGLAGAIVSLSTGAVKTALGPLGGLVPALGPVPAILIAIASASPEVRASLVELLRAFQPLVPVAERIATITATGLNAALPVTASAVEALARAVTPLVSTVAGLPAPLLAGVAGFLAFRTAIGPLEPLFVGGGKAVLSFTGYVRDLVQDARMTSYLATMEGGASRLSGVLAGAGTVVARFGAALKSAFVANAPALVIMGVVAAGSLLVTMLAAQAQKAAEANKRMAEYRDTMTSAGEATAATTEKIRDNVKALFEGSELGGVKAWVDRVGGADAAFLKFGTTADIVAAAVRSGGPAYDTLIAQLQAQSEETEKAQNALSRNGGYTDRQTQAAQAAGELQKAVEQQRAELEAAAKAQAAMTEKQRAAAAAMGDAYRSNSRLNEALVIARDITKDATERLSALKQALDELKGGGQTAAEQEKVLNDRARDLADAFSAADENGRKLADSLVDGAGKIDTTTAAGSRLFDATKAINDEMLTAILAEDKLAKKRGESGVSAQRAAEVAQPYIDRLKTIAAQSGLSQEKVDGLVKTMMSTPQVVAYLVTDNGTIDVNKQQLLILAQQILSTPDKQFEVSSRDFPGLRDALAALGFDITHLPAGQVRVRKDDGSFQSVEDAIRYLTRSRTMTVVSDFRNSVAGRPYMNSVGNAYFSPGVAHAFASGGFPTGIYPGGRPLYKFAEPETGWEAFISGRRGQERRNLAIAAEATTRLQKQAGVNPSSQAFADGAFVRAVSSPASELGAALRSEVRAAVEDVIQIRAGDTNVTFVNPVVRDPQKDAWEAAQLLD